MPFAITDLGFSGAGGDIYEYWDAEDGVRDFGAVDDWASLSPTALAPAQTTAGLKPDYSPVSFNDWRPGITGDGSSKYLRVANLGNLPTGATECEVWALVYQPHLGADASTRVIGAFGGGSSTNRTDVRRGVNSGVNRGNANSGSGSAEQTRVNASVDFSGYKLIRYRKSATSHQTDVDGVAGASTGSLTFNVSSSGNITLFANTGSTPGQYGAFTISFFLVTKPLDSTKAGNVKAFADARIAALSFSATSFGPYTTIHGEDYARSSHSATYAIQDNDAVAHRHQRFEVRNGDYAAFDGTSRNRAELQGQTNWPFETDIWTSFMFRVRSGASLTASFNIIGQFHAAPDTGDTVGEPPFAMNLRTDETVRFIRRYCTTDPTLVGAETQVPEFDTDPINRDQWYRVVARHRFSYAVPTPPAMPTGELEVWWDGTRIINRTGVNYGYNDPDGPYWKYGIYRAAATETLVVEVANMEVGTTDLSARIDAPLPIVE